MIHLIILVNLWWQLAKGVVDIDAKKHIGTEPPLPVVHTLTIWIETAKQERLLEQVRVVDSHTGGEPTRTVIEGGPDLGSGDLKERRFLFQKDHEAFRRALVTEPRASEAVVGALLCQPTRPDCVTGVIFFNNSGCLGMCGHGTIGVAV